uniref:Complex I assembly factor TIMMDC1, mitochondrial n=1 Tax=Amblyomma triste TaxID=251400 RepID=A0A023GAG5_AMBTT
MPFEDNSKISSVPEGLRSEMFRPEYPQMSTAFANETGMDRLKKMFDISSGPGPELQMVESAGFVGAIIGSMVGGWNYSTTARIDYIRRNQATSFLNAKQASRELQDAMFLAFARGAFRVGWRTGTFSAIYMTTVIAGFTYRNKFGIAEHVAGGALAGFLFKMNMGIAGSLIGAGLGGLLGLAGGTLMSLGTKAYGLTVPEFRYWQHNYWIQEYSEKKEKWKEGKAAKPAAPSS